MSAAGELANQPIAGRSPTGTDADPSASATNSGLPEFAILGLSKSAAADLDRSPRVSVHHLRIPCLLLTSHTQLTLECQPPVSALITSPKRSHLPPLNCIILSCSIGAKSVGPVLTLMPGISVSGPKSFRLAACFI